MRVGSYICSVMLIACLKPVEAFGDPRGVWIPANRDSLVTRIHVSGAALNYTAMIDYRCGLATCSTLQSLVEGDNTPHPSTFSVSLEGIGPAPILELRWQPGPPCNRASSDENPLVVWGSASASGSGKTHFSPVGRATCFVHPPAPPSARQPPSTPRIPRRATSASH